MNQIIKKMKFNVAMVMVICIVNVGRYGLFMFRR